MSRAHYSARRAGTSLFVLATPISTLTEASRHHFGKCNRQKILSPFETRDFDHGVRERSVDALATKESRRLTTFAAKNKWK